MRLLALTIGLCILLAQDISLAGGVPDAAEGNTAEPVVLLHGLGRNNTAMWKLASRLEEDGFDVHRIGYSSFKESPGEMIASVTMQINECCADETRAVHFVGHSLGGLLIRAYLQSYRPPVLGNTVLIGTPNSGTEIADHFEGHALVEYLLPAATQLGTSPESLPNRLPEPDYPVGIIAGVVDSELGEHFFPGPNDGMVPVESTQLDSMTDFIVLETGHSMMRYDRDVAIQVIHFLEKGGFLRE